MTPCRRLGLGSSACSSLRSRHAVSRSRFGPLSSLLSTQFPSSPTTLPSRTASSSANTSPPPKRWASDLLARVGRCVSFGCPPELVPRAAAVVGALAAEWRALVAGSEGYLTGGGRGLEDRRVIWGEMDTFGHVNNTNYFRYAESSRVEWFNYFAVHVDPGRRKEWLSLMAPGATGLIMKTLTSEFKMPLVYPDTISVYHKIRYPPPPADGAPATSITLDCVVLSHVHRRVAAQLEEDVAVYDYAAGRRTGVPEFVARAFGETARLQEQEAARARARIWKLVGEVEALEGLTWNREGAVEDMGKR